MTKTHAISTRGDAEKRYLEQLREAYNKEANDIFLLRGEAFYRAKRNLERQARFYKCLSGNDITDRGARRG